MCIANAAPGTQSTAAITAERHRNFFSRAVMKHSSKYKKSPSQKREGVGKEGKSPRPSAPRVLSVRAVRSALSGRMEHGAGLPAQASLLRLCLPMCTHSGVLSAGALPSRRRSRTGISPVSLFYRPAFGAAGHLILVSLERIPYFPRLCNGKRRVFSRCSAPFTARSDTEARCRLRRRYCSRPCGPARRCAARRKRGSAPCFPPRSQSPPARQ